MRPADAPAPSRQTLDLRRSAAQQHTPTHLYSAPWRFCRISLSLERGWPPPPMQPPGQAMTWEWWWEWRGWRQQQQCNEGGMAKEQQRGAVQLMREHVAQLHTSMP